MDSERIIIRRATPADTEAYSKLRLEALREHPEAFGADYQANLQLSPEDWETQLKQRADGQNTVLYFACDDDELVGMTGVYRGSAPKSSHNGGIWGVYVRDTHRGQGIAVRLLNACIDWAARHQIEYLKLAVVTTNIAAIRAYTAAGFQVYGVEPKVLRVDGVDYDEMLMVRQIRSG